MPNNGKVNSVGVSSSGNRGASVSFPNPNPPPEYLTPPTVYTDLSADQYATFLAAFTADAKVDTTEGPETPPSCTGVTAHR